MTWWTSWRLALRLARRDLFKNKARAIIALAMVTLPVFGVITADILIQTNDVSVVEGVDRQLGTAATAAVSVSGDGSGSSPAAGRPATAADIRKAIGDRTMLRFETNQALVETAKGRELAMTRGLDGAAPLARGLLTLVSGRWPRSASEVVVNQGLRDDGIGDAVRIAKRDRTEMTLKVVGTVRDATYRSDPVIAGLPGWLPRDARPGEVDGSWLVDGPRLTDADMAALDAIGASASDRYRLLHPGQFQGDDYSSSDNTAQVVALIVVSAAFMLIYLALFIVVAFILWKVFAANTDPANSIDLLGEEKKPATVRWRDPSGTVHVDQDGQVRESHSGTLMGNVDSAGRVSGTDGTYRGSVGSDGRVR